MLLVHNSWLADLHSALVVINNHHACNNHGGMSWDCWHQLPAAHVRGWLKCLLVCAASHHQCMSACCVLASEAYCAHGYMPACGKGAEKSLLLGCSCGDVSGLSQNHMPLPALHLLLWFFLEVC